MMKIMDNAIWGMPVYVYNGKNAEAIIKALGLNPGDAIVALPGRPAIMKAQEWAELKASWTTQVKPGYCRG